MACTTALLGRRTVLAASAALLAGAGPEAQFRLRPEPEPLVRVDGETAGTDGFRLWIEGCADPVQVPARRARRLPDLPIAGRAVLAVAFGADLPTVCEQDLVALVGWDGTRLRILALETLAWRRQDGAAFRMRLLATGDRHHLALDCVAQLARPVTRPSSRVWTDLLQWHDTAPLGDALPRPPLAGSWQAAMGDTRRQVAAFLAEPRTTLTDEDLATSGLLQQFGCMADS